MAIPGVAVPGSVVASGSAVSPAGPQGIQGPQGTAGAGGGGGAGTKTFRKFSANDGNPTATLYAVWATRNNTPILGFNDTTAWQTFFIDVVPEGAVLTSGLTINILWAAASATTGNVKWNAQIERMNTTIAADSFDTAGTITTACNGSNGVPSLSSIVGLTTIDGITIGDTYRILVTRDAANGADTMTGDAQLISVEVRSAN